MSETLRVDIPTKPHIRKFAHCMFGYPLQLSHHHPLGTILLALLQNSNDCGLNEEQRKKRRKRLSATVHCFASLHQGRKNGMDISDHQIININRLLEAEFEKALYYYVLRHTGKDGRYRGHNEALKGFMMEYHICDNVDMQFETLKKTEYRYRQKLEQTKEQSEELCLEDCY